MAGGEKEASETSTLLKLYQQFGNTTSMHGIGRVLTNSSRWKRVVWSVMFLFGLTFAVYQFVITMSDYYSYPVTTEVILQHENMARFPGVTICNLNMKRKSMVDKHLQDMIEAFEKPSQSVLKETYAVLREEIVFELLYNNTKADDNESGHQLSDMLIKCVFNRNVCSEANFTRVNTITYGACYTFKVTDDVLHEYTTISGPQNGLILELNIEQDEYLPITTTSGAKVIVHPIDEYPFPEDGGILAHPGVVTSIEFKKIITHRLPAPYSTCVDASEQSSTLPNLFRNKKYMQTACMKSCYQLSMYFECGCCDTDMPCDYISILNVDPTAPNETDEVLVCSFLVKFLCDIFVEDLFLTSKLNCYELCPPSCDRTIFDTVVSSALWPSRLSFNVFVEFLHNTILQNKSVADNASLELYIRSNFLRLEIFMDSLEFLEFTAHAKYDWNLLLGTVGGLLGLWLGFSLLTTMEIVEVLIDTVLYCTRIKHKKKTTNQTEQN